MCVCGGEGWCHHIVRPSRDIPSGKPGYKIYKLTTHMKMLNTLLFYAKACLSTNDVLQLTITIFPHNVLARYDIHAISMIF